MKTAIITTTINIPVLLEDYIKDGQKYNHDFFFIIIGDKKTPPETKKFCKVELGTTNYTCIVAKQKTT